MMRNVAECGKKFDKRLTNRKKSARMFDTKKENMKSINVSVTWRDRCGRCVSFNGEEYPPFDLPVNDIYDYAKVLGVATINLW